MTRRATTVLLVTCAWTLFVWIVAIKNLVIDNHPVGFRVVHGILAAISIGLGIAVGMIGWRARAASTPAQESADAHLARH